MQKLLASIILLVVSTISRFYFQGGMSETSVAANSTLSSSETATSSVTLPATSADDLFAAVRAKVNEKISSTASVGPARAIDQELEMYFDYVKELNKESTSIDPILVWNSQSARLPRMYDIAVDIPATTAPVERVFSRASLVLSKNRHNLSDAMLETEVFYKFNADFVTG